ncbi:hypothetical protein BX600DRAFT_116886 [Xylariales sp. PMI_506]|nr:hypothetical protein BX600DRAFT_116886 [Xylariales sp. PMI_506]
MLSIPLSHLLSGAALLAAGLVRSSPVPLITERDTAELYVFANCVNNSTGVAYAAIFWYYPDFLPDYPEPQATAVVDDAASVDYAGDTTSVTTPFTLTATIPANATGATAGDIVSTEASASSFAGPMAVFKGTGDVFYTPETDVNCYEEYYQQDHQTSV